MNQMNYFNGYGYHFDSCRLYDEVFGLGELETMVKAARRDRVIARVLRAVLVVLAVNMFAEPMFTNIPVFTAWVMAIALLFLAECAGSAINRVDQCIRDLQGAVDGYDAYRLVCQKHQAAGMHRENGWA